jgi:DNA-binding CsgD family transcriptional regulator
MIAFDNLLDAATPQALACALQASLGDHGVSFVSLRTGAAPGAPPAIATTMPERWIAYYRDQRYAEIDPGPADAMRAVSPLKMCFSESHPGFTWRGRLRGMGRELAEIDVRGAVVVPLAPLPGEAYCLATFFTGEPSHLFDGWAAETRVHLEQAAAIAHYRLRQLRAATAEAGRDVTCRLTERETEVLARFAAGERVARVAWHLGLSPRTVEFHLSNARRKLRAKTREQAVAVAVRDGLIVF